MREPQEREKKAFALIFFSIRKWEKNVQFFFVRLLSLLHLPLFLKSAADAET